MLELVLAVICAVAAWYLGRRFERQKVEAEVAAFSAAWALQLDEPTWAKVEAAIVEAGRDWPRARGLWASVIRAAAK